MNREFKFTIELSGISHDIIVEKNKLIISFSDCLIEFYPNALYTNCNIDSVFQSLDEKRKYLYIKSELFVKKGDETKQVHKLRKPVLANSFLINKVSTEIGDYLVIVTPGSFTYDRIILSDAVLAVEFSGRKLFRARRIEDGVRFFTIKE